MSPPQRKTNGLIAEGPVGRMVRSGSASVFPSSQALPCQPYPTLQKELALREQGDRFVAGLDEAGRGAWAGPVAAAAVIFRQTGLICHRCWPV